MKRLFSALRAVCMALFCIMVPLSAFSMLCETFCDGCEVDDREKCKNSLYSFCNCGGVDSVESCTVDADSLGKTCQECVDNNLFGSRVTPSCECKTVTTCRVLVYYYEAQACSAMSYYTQSKTATDASISLDPPTWAKIGEYGCSLPPTGTYLVGWCTNSEGCTSSEYPAGKTVSCSGSNNNTLHLYPYYAKCPNGTYSNNGNCEDCPAGSYCTGGVKYACGDGKWSSAGATSESGCLNIKAGCYGSSADKECPNTCPAGKYSEAGKASCTVCADGTISESTGAASCSLCPARYYCVGGVKYEVGSRNYATGCGTNHNYDCDVNAANCEGCKGQQKCPSAETRFYCSSGKKLSCAGAFQLTGCDSDDNKGCTGCDPCPDGQTVDDGTGSQCVACPKGYYCKDGVKTKVSTGHYAINCNSDGEGCKGELKCSAGHYCKDGQLITVQDGRYAIGCSEGALDSSKNCIGDGCKGCTGDAECPAGSSYCIGGKKIAVQTGYYATGCGTNHDYVCDVNAANCKGCKGETQCPAGSYCTGGKKITCADGTISEVAGATTCPLCPAGYYCTGGVKYEVGSRNYATGCGTNHDYDCIGNDVICEGCKGKLTCPDAELRFYCENGRKLSCDKNKQLTGCTTDGNKGCTGCKACDDGKTADISGSQCVPCPDGYFCKDGEQKEVSTGHYATGCGTNNNSDCDSDYCTGCKGEEKCPTGHYCTYGKKTQCDPGEYQGIEGQTSCDDVDPGYYATGCIIGGDCVGANCKGCRGQKICPKANADNGYYYCEDGQKKACGAKYYLNTGDGGATSCTLCPEGTRFATTAVVGVGNCGLQTCLDYYNNDAKDNVPDLNEWLENWRQCSSDGSSLTGCYMAPTKGINGALVYTGAGTKPKCCSEGGTFEKCYYDNGMESCIAGCDGCRTAENADCSSIQLPDTSHTCPGVQEVGKPLTCDATIQCYCPHNPYMKYCSTYMNDAEDVGNGTDKCYDGGEESGRTDYCKDVCYKECYDIPCTQQCPDFLNNHKDSVDGCSETTSKTYTGRQYTGFECKYYNDSGAQVDAPNCPDFAFTCAANYYYNSDLNKCTKCLDGYHTPGGQKLTTCTPNVYKVTLDLAEGENGTTEFFYKYNTITGNCAYYTSENVSKCLDVVDGKQTVQKPTRTGYTFAGYYTAANGEGTQYVDNAGKIIKDIYKELDGKTLYAKWTPKQFTVTFNTNGAAGAAVPPSTTCKYDDYNDVVDPCTAATQGSMLKDLHEFKGWKHNGNGKSYNAGVKFGENISTGDNITLYAIWDKCLDCVPSTGSKCEPTVVDNRCTYDSGCIDGYTVVDGEDTREPKCTPNVYKVTLNLAGGESETTEFFYKFNTITGNCAYYTSENVSNCLEATSDGKQKVKTPTRTGYTFDGYYTEAGGEGDKYVDNAGIITKDIYKIIGNKTLYAKWTAIKYSAIYSCNGGDVDPTQDPGPDTVAFDDDYEVDNTNRGCSKTGSLFQGWQGTNNGTTISAPYKGEPKTKFTWKQAGDITFTAQWKDCPMGYYCGNGIAEQNACPVGSTNGGGAKVITDCYLLGGQSKICSKIGDEEPECFTLPAGVKVNYSVDLVSPAE